MRLDTLRQLTQRSGEPLITWAVRICDAGAAGILTDDGDAHKFGTISNESFVQQAVRDKANRPGDSDLLEIVAERYLKKYPIESAWPGRDCPGALFSCFLKYFIYLFIYGCVGFSFLCEGFLQLRQVGAILHRGAQASHYRGLSCCGAQAPDAQAQ